MVNEKERKITVWVPTFLVNEMARRKIETGLSQKNIVGKSVWAYLTSFVRADDALKKLILDVQISEDPEDRLEVPMDLERLKVLHSSIHEALRKVGEDPNECKA